MISSGLLYCARPNAMPMLAEVKTSRPPIENGALSAFWMRKATALACVLVAERVQQNREFVAAEPGEHVALPQARLEPARHGDQQLVADQVAEAVVDDLEAIEVEIEHREPAAAAPLLELVEPASEPLDEHRAVATGRSADRGSRRCAAAPARWPARSCRSASRRCESRAVPAPRTATPRHRNRR